jgi:hypothetical protein
MENNIKMHSEFRPWGSEIYGTGRGERPAVGLYDDGEESLKFHSCTTSSYGYLVLEYELPAMDGLQWDF